MHILNIGLVTSLNHFKGGNLPQGAILTEVGVLSHLVHYGFDLLWSKVTYSNTEKTLVVAVSAHGLTDGDRFKLNKLSNTLQQDCIAVFDALNGEGHLIGDYADDWGGEFNAEFFLVG